MAPLTHLSSRCSVSTGSRRERSALLHHPVDKCLINLLKFVKARYHTVAVTTDLLINDSSRRNIFSFIPQR